MDNGESSYRRFLDGDESAFGEILDMHSENLIFFINRYVNNVAIAQELSEDVFVTPVNKHLLEIIIKRLEESERIDISHLSQYLTSEEVSVVARLLANQAMVSNTMKECEDCLLVLEEEKRKRETPTPANMSDDSFLEFFNSLKKDENN